jgi:hypothetical protein
MKNSGLETIARSMWKAQNEAKVIDALSSFLMTEEYDQYEPKAQTLVNMLYGRGYVIAPRTPATANIGEVLPELKKYKDHPIVDAVRERLNQLYVASILLASGDLGDHGFRSIVFDVLNEERPNGVATEALEVRMLEQEAKLIEVDLREAGYQLVSRIPSASLIERLINQTVKNSAIAIVFGEDPARIGDMCRTMIEHERVR